LKCAEVATDLTHETYLSLRQHEKKIGLHENARALAFHIALKRLANLQVALNE